MNKKGFTLIEVISVIILLGIVIVVAVPNILGGSERTKELSLKSKIENIEKAAVLYGQDNRNKISKLITDNKTLYPLCFKENTLIQNCYYFEKGGVTTITVGFLANPTDDVGNQIEPYINYDEGSNILNPVDETKNMNNCKIQIYQKYGKIYADYVDDVDGNKNCWK